MQPLATHPVNLVAGLLGSEAAVSAFRGGAIDDAVDFASHSLLGAHPGTGAGSDPNGLSRDCGKQVCRPDRSRKAAAIVFLLSPAASYITGSCIRIDGGAPNARRGWWDLQPAKNNVAFDGFHRSSLPAILDEVR